MLLGPFRHASEKCLGCNTKDTVKYALVLYVVSTCLGLQNSLVSL